MTDKKREHPQKAASREWITNALLDLMKEKPYKEINVTELSKRADLSRRTFYRHFKTVDDVMHFYMGKIGDAFISFAPADSLAERDFVRMVLLHFSFWEKYKEFLLLLKENDLLFMLLQKFMLGVQAKRMKDTAPREEEYIGFFITGGQWTLLIHWIEDGMKYTPQEMAQIAARIEQRFRAE